MNPIFTIEGRAGRGTFIGHTLLITLIVSCVYAIISVFGGLPPEQDAMLFTVMTMLGALLWAFPEARRFHDMDMTAWWVVGTWIPLLNIVLFLMLLLRRGTRGVNSYGLDPLIRYSAIPSHLSSTIQFDHDAGQTQSPPEPPPDTPINAFDLVGPGGMFGTNYLLTMRRNTLLLMNRKNNEALVIDPNTGEYGMIFRNTLLSRRPISLISRDGEELRFRASGSAVSALKKWWRTHEYALQTRYMSEGDAH